MTQKTRPIILAAYADALPSTARPIRLPADSAWSANLPSSARATTGSVSVRASLIIAAVLPYPPAFDEVFGDDVEHRTSKFKNNHLEQDHRGVKGRTRPMRGFQTHISAHRFCRAHDEVRNFLRPATRRNQHVPAAQRRAIHAQRVAALRDMLAIA
ncbi:DDE-type integrase/transposase/recombinase [Azospirillum sp. A26]|uniref:DDE-type integrase/transposase/recombinase n=1 Tax=Azospirillum sp. A26 TaxID=3160607 RepID=UPI00366D7A9A